MKPNGMAGGEAGSELGPSLGKSPIVHQDEVKSGLSSAPSTDCTYKNVRFNELEMFSLDG